MYIRVFTAIVFIALTVVYFFFTFGTVDEAGPILTVSTFLFATFTGFFMARQGARYSTLRGEIAKFDGHLSALYRNMTHLGKKKEAEAKKIIRKHYNSVLKHGWDYPFMHKTTTLTDLHSLMTVKKKNLSPHEYLAIEYSMNSLQQLQVSRKNMVNLHLERIPMYQWVLIIILGVILLLAVSAIPTLNEIVPSVLKASFGTSIIVVMIILWELNSLKFFESDFGERSAKDVLDTMAGKK